MSRRDHTTLPDVQPCAADQPVGRSSMRRHDAWLVTVLSAVVLFVACLAGSASAARADGRDVPVRAEPTPKPEKEKASANGDEKKTDDGKDEDKDKKEEKPDRFFAVTGAVVHTVTDGTRYGVTILAKNGKIHAIGTNVAIPEDAEQLDASGFHLYPGLIAADSSGILGAEPPDDTTNVYSLSMNLALAGGITTAASGNTAAKLSFGTTDDMIVGRGLFEKLSYSTRKPNARRKLRESLDKVRQYIRDLEAYREAKKNDPDAEEPEKDWLKGTYQTHLKLLRREKTAVMSANTAHELLDACELARRYGIRVVVRGAVEGWTVAQQMAQAGLSAVITPRADRPRDQRLNRPNGSSIENAAILHRHGVPIAIIPQIAAITTWGVAGRDLLHLNMEAGFAVRGGLSDADALRAITIDAARVLGIDHRVGSIEVGKDADFVIADGDILHYMTLTRWTIVNGRIAYDKNKDTLFDHIRKDGDPDAPPPDDYWPKRLGAGE